MTTRQRSHPKSSESRKRAISFGNNLDLTVIVLKYLAFLVKNSNMLLNHFKLLCTNSLKQGQLYILVQHP